MKKLLIVLLLANTLALSQNEVDMSSSHQQEKINDLLSTEKDRTHLSMSIYPNNLAMVKDTRNVLLPKGQHLLSFEHVSNQLIPASAIFSGTGMTVLQQVFDYALINTQNMLRLSTGKTIQIIHTNETTGAQTIEEAEIITTKPQLVVKTMNGIEIISDVDRNKRIIFTEVPKGLSKAPALKLFLNNNQENNKDKSVIELTYLTNGLTWKADYVAKLNTDHTKMDLYAFATVTNNTEISYQNTFMNVIAGDVPRNTYDASPQLGSTRIQFKALSSEVAFARNESLGNLQLFKLPNQVSIDSQQTRQFPLLPVVSMKIEEILTAHHYFYGQQESIDANYIERPKVTYQFKNTSNSPLPKGELRVYETDSDQQDHFTGETWLKDIAKDENVNLSLGTAYDIKITRKQVSWKPITVQSTNSGGIARYEIEISNASDKDKLVNLVEEILGINKVLEESLTSEKINSKHYKWKVKVPAKGKITVAYTIYSQNN